ncbi:dipeptidyl peptidase 2-like [Clytia hemisphaerica]
MKIIFLFVCIGLALAYPHPLKSEPYQTKYIGQFIDHFNFLGSAGPNGRYQQRYLISDAYFDGKGPILFYTGNEGDITNFWDNTGFVFALAKRFKGLILFGEHRYYGKSLPFGDQSFKGDNIGFLTTEQALADFAYLVKQVKKDHSAQNNTVFAFGGSYGGMLTAYMRYKYPDIIDGGVASSAPFMTVAGNRPRSEFWEAVTNTFHKADSTCPTSVQQGFSALIKLFDSGDVGKQVIQSTFNLCPEQMKNPNLKNNVLLWARNAFTLLAMVDYPYPADFMAKLPGHPVNVACSYIKGANKLSGLANITSLLYGPDAKCHDTFTEYVYCADPTGCGTGPDAPPWDYQACTELALPGSSTNETDMFPPLQFTLEMRQHYCAGKFGLGMSRNDWYGTHYFGTLDEIKHASRLIFPNGDLDPWMPGGVLEDLSDDLIAIVIEGGAHHLDLREANDADPQSVIDAREKIATILQNWMEHPEKK